MRAYEFLIEKTIGRGTVNNVYIEINDHSWQRKESRDVSPRAVDSILRSLGSFSNQIQKIEEHYEFWVYSTKWNTAVGFRRLPDVDNKLHVMLNTLLSDPPHEQGKNPVIYIP
jgi:hypothetical protein